MSRKTKVHHSWFFVLLQAIAIDALIFTEYLTGVGQLPATGAFYVFLNPKFENNHGGPGRAIGILPLTDPANTH